MKTEWIDLDVRPMLATGREPFALIMNHLDTLESGQGLRLTAPFYPKPLVEMLKQQGWTAESSALEGDDWEVRISRAEATKAPREVELDLRELAPPEPMVRILECLESMDADERLVALTPFFPENLFPVLEERGFRWEMTQENGRTCRLTISRA